MNEKFELGRESVVTTCSGKMQREKETRRKAIEIGETSCSDEQKLSDRVMRSGKYRSVPLHPERKAEHLNTNFEGKRACLVRNTEKKATLLQRSPLRNAARMSLGD